MENVDAIKSKNAQPAPKQPQQDERTVAGRFYTPTTDIVETDKALLVTMDVPGVQKENVKVKLENNVLEVEGHIDDSPYRSLSPIYSEYNIGHYSRRFTVSNKVDTKNIEANLTDGVLTLTLPMLPEAEARTISVN